MTIKRLSVLSLFSAALVFAPSSAFADELDDLLDLGDGGAESSGGKSDAAEGGDGAPADGHKDQGEGSDEGSGGEASPEASGNEAGERGKLRGVINPRDETIFAIQKKGRYLGKRWELVPMGVVTLNNKFTAHAGGLVNGLYHFAETMSVEFSGGYLHGEYTAMTRELLDLKSLTPPGADYALLSWYTGLDMQWAPIYGKFRLAGRALGHFDMYMGVGLGLSQAGIREVSEGSGEGGGQIGEEFNKLAIKVVSNLGAGLRFYFTDRFGVRAEFRNYAVAHSVPGDPQKLNPTRELVWNNVTQNSVDVANILLFQFGPSFVF